MTSRNRATLSLSILCLFSTATSIASYTLEENDFKPCREHALKELKRCFDVSAYDAETSCFESSKKIYQACTDVVTSRYSHGDYDKQQRIAKEKQLRQQRILKQHNQ